MRNLFTRTYYDNIRMAALADRHPVLAWMVSIIALPISMILAVYGGALALSVPLSLFLG